MKMKKEPSMDIARSSIVDAFDIETFLLCRSVEEAKARILEFIRGLGFSDIDVISIDFRGFGARVRARVYMNRPGSTYPWLSLFACNGEGALDEK